MTKTVQNGADKLSLYVHIPFCEKKCFYCSFVVSIGQERRINEYLECIQKEAKQFNRPAIRTIFIGGGTPSFLNAEQMKFLFEIIRKNFNVAEHAEVTLEANPESIDIAKAKILKELGVNRISLGAQSMSDDRLKYLGRTHRAEDTVKAYRVLREARLDNISLDLMFCFPGQTQEQLSSDLQKITELKSDHLSLYMLTVEENSRFYARQIGLPQDDVQAGYYQYVIDYLKDCGYAQYEVSNFALPGKESLHNLRYWQGGNYIGLGVGAHSHRNGRRWWNKDRFMDYIKSVNAGENPQQGYEELSGEKRLIEALLFGLRMNRGVDLSELEATYQIVFPLVTKAKIEMLQSEGLLVKKNDRFCVTDRGRCVLDEICAQLI